MVKPLPFSIYIADAVRVTHFHLTYLFYVQKYLLILSEKMTM